MNKVYLNEYLRYGYHKKLATMQKGINIVLTPRGWLGKNNSLVP